MRFRGNYLEKLLGMNRNSENRFIYTAGAAGGGQERVRESREQ